MAEGAGSGPGLKGDGSQNEAEGTSTGDAAPGSGKVTGTPNNNGNSDDEEDNAAGLEPAPFIVTGLVAALTLIGTLLL